MMRDNTQNAPERIPTGGELRSALRAVRRKISFEPEIAMILGSGLGGLADAVRNGNAIGTSEIPYYPRSTVSGHDGRVVFGMLENRRVVVVQGRAHVYEGYSPHAVAFPVKLVHALGAAKLLVTNAAGGIHPGLRPGTLMLISDHIDMVQQSTYSFGSEASAAERRLKVYDPAWLDLAEEIALRKSIRTQRGVYLWSRGPSYETKTEIQVFRMLGADAVGMSTVPEVKQARSLGMKVLGISSITNPAAGLSKERLSHEDVLRVGRLVQVDLEKLVRGFIHELSETGC